MNIREFYLNLSNAIALQQRQTPAIQGVLADFDCSGLVKGDMQTCTILIEPQTKCSVLDSSKET